MKTPEQMHKQEEIKIRRDKKITQKLLRVFELFFITLPMKISVKSVTLIPDESISSLSLFEYYPQ